MEMLLAIKKVQETLGDDECLLIMLPNDRAIEIWKEDEIQQFYGFIEIKKERKMRNGLMEHFRVIFVPEKVILMTISEKEML